MDLRTMLGHVSFLLNHSRPLVRPALRNQSSTTFFLERAAQGCEPTLAWEKGLARKPTAFKTLKCNKNVLNPLKSIAARGVCKASNFQLLQGTLKTDLKTTR